MSPLKKPIVSRNSLFPVNRDRLRRQSGTQKPVPSIGNATILNVFFVLIQFVIYDVTRHPDKSGLSLLAPKPGAVTDFFQ